MGLLFKTLRKQKLHYKGFLFSFLFLFLIASIANVVMTVLTGDMGQAAVDMDMSVLVHLFVILTGVMIIRAIASAVSALLIGRFAGRAGYRFRETFAEFFLQKPFSKFESVNSGEVLSVFSNDLPNATELVSNGGIRMIADIITLVVAVAYMMYINWWLSLIYFAAFPVLVLMQVLIANPIQKKRERVLETRAAINAVANDSFQNTSVIVAYSLEAKMEERCRAAFSDMIDAVKNAVRSQLLLVLAGILASTAPLLIIIAVSAGQVINGNMNIAEWIAFISLAGETGGWLSMLSQRQDQVKTTSAGAKRMGDYLNEEPEDITVGNILIPDGNIAISAENLSFSYQINNDSKSETGAEANEKISDETDDINGEKGNTESNSEDECKTISAIDDISFEIKKGARVAFVGGSGSGKSTVLKLLLGLYAPQKGKLSVMGEETSAVSLKSLRDVFAYVPQDSFLFPETIAENITSESIVSDKKRLEKACSDAGILEFIESLPAGFDANLSESAENVSGGQKQRIALARAFYRNAPIVLFDEATSALDPQTEAAVLQSFKTLAKDKTVIMVAHRPKAVDFCDYIIVMDNGKIAAIGTHDELLKESVVYANLCNARQTEVPA